MSQPGYDPTQHQQPYTAAPQPHHPAPFPVSPSMNYSPGQAEAKKLHDTSLVLGILGLFIFGLVFGPLAIINANKAERMGHPATAGKLLGWTALILSALGLVVFLLMTLAAWMSGTH